MRKTLKRDLRQYIQAMGHGLMCLELSLQQATELQIRSLETLSRGIEGLRSTVDVLPTSNNPVCSIVRHALYNQLTVIGGSAQIMIHTYTDHIQTDTVSYLDKIVASSRHIEAALQADKAVTHSVYPAQAESS